MKYQPRYQHDCKSCIFLRRIGKLDLYVCPSAIGKSTTYILRFGDDAPEYASCTDFHNRMLHAMYRENNSMRPEAVLPYTINNVRELEYYFLRVGVSLLAGAVIDRA